MHLKRSVVVSLFSLCVAGCGLTESQANKAAQRALDLLEEGSWQAAQKVLEEPLQKRPNTAWVQEAHGRIALARLRPDLALEPFKKAVHLGDHPRRRGLLARAWMGMGRLDDASDELSNALAQQSDDLEVLQDAVYVFAATGQITQALALSQRLLAMDEGNPRTNIRVASAYLRAGKAHEANQLVRTLDLSLLSNLEDLVLLGKVEFDLKHGERAVKAFELAQEKLPDSARLLYNLGSARILQKDFRKAKGDFEKALKINPKDALAMGQMAYCLSQIGRKDTARKVLAEALTLAPEDPVLRVLQTRLSR